jgi:hypothetical protein
MSIQEVAPEQLAQLFHHYHQALTSDSTGSSDAPESWEQLPQQEKRRLVSAARLTLLELSATPTKKEEVSRRYFAKPGEAEWGC